MAYLNFQNCTRAEYEKVLYSQDARNKIRIWFNNVELQNAGLYCERATIKSRIVPNGAKVFSLNNFISKEIELILHDVAESTIVDQVRISIGTLVNDVYEYVPIGIFNIQDSPVNDKGRITIKLRDNSTKFDFNYNAQPLIDAHEVYLKTEDATYQQGKTYYKYENGTYTLLVAGTDYQNGDVISGNNIYYKTNAATKLQILQDICTKAGVTCNINSFIGSTDLVGTYDNSITAREYISRLAENAGRIATINRNGELIFINIKNLITWDIPLEVVEKYENGTKYKIGKVVYEDGTRSYILAPIGLTNGNKVVSGNKVDIKPGNCMPIEAIPVGTLIHNIELNPGQGGKLVRAAGQEAQLMAKEGKYAHVRLPSGEMRLVLSICRATIGTVGNTDHENVELGKAGKTRHLGKRPEVRGSAMNPNDHPHGGGEGKAPVGHAGPMTPWGKPALGYKTRKKNRKSDKMIVKRRK